MTGKDIQAIVLAAGKSRRFNTGTSKQLARICGQAMVLYPLRMLKSLDVATTVILGHDAERIQKEINAYISDVNFTYQSDQLGTGHAVASSRGTWERDSILILNGDVPLISNEIIENLYKKHTASNATLSFLSAHVLEPHGYGRVITHDGQVRIIEEKDCDDKQRDVNVVNAGIYLVKRDFLEHALSQLGDSNSSGEYYLTDIVEMAHKENKTIEVVSVPYDNVRGVNTLEDLWAAEQIKRSELIKYWMSQGVRFDLAQCIHIDWNVSIGAGTFIGSGVHVLGNTRIGKNCTINAFSILENVEAEDNVFIHSHSVVQDSKIGAGSEIGPFARFRNNVVTAPNVTVGNFVEVKNSTLGQDTKAKHLSYIGDADLGKSVNIGAGTITCNHDGVNKHKTTIKDNAYVGSNSTLVAPVTLEKGAFSAAGSTVTKDVGEGDLAIGRARQENKEGYARKLREKKTKDKKIFASFKTDYSSKELT